MSFLIQFVATYAPWIYATCGLVALYQIYRIWLVRGERRQAVFSLEREKATRDLVRIFYVAMLLLFSMGLTYFVSTTLAKAVEPLVAESVSPNPQLPFVPTPTNTPLAAIATPTMTPTLAPTVSVTPTLTAGEETPTPAPTAAPVVQAPFCPDNRSVLLRPGQGETVRGTTNIIGTATHDQFQYYKVEYAAGADAQSGFSYIAGGSSPVVNGVLGTVDTTALGNGLWTLRLIVVDQTGNFPPPCQVTLNVAN